MMTNEIDLLIANLDAGTKALREARVHLAWMAVYESMGVGATCLARIGAAITLALNDNDSPGALAVQAGDDLIARVRRLATVVDASLAETYRNEVPR